MFQYMYEYINKYKYKHKYKAEVSEVRHHDSGQAVCACVCA